MTGHEDPRCCAPAGTTFCRDLGHNAAQIRQRGGFIRARKRDPGPSAGLAAAQKTSKDYGDSKRRPDERGDTQGVAWCPSRISRSLSSGVVGRPVGSCGLLAANDLLALLPAASPEAQVQIAARGMRPFGTTGKSAKAVYPFAQKYSASPRRANQGHNFAHLTYQRGVGHVTNARWDAVDANGAS